MTFDEYKKLDEFEREKCLRHNGIQVSINIDNCRHSYAYIYTPNKTYVAGDRSGLLEYLELIYLWYYVDLQKLFEQEVQDFLQQFQGQIIYRDNLYRIKYGIQSIMRKYRSDDYVKVTARGYGVDISQSLMDFDVQISN